MRWRGGGGVQSLDVPHIPVHRHTCLQSNRLTNRWGKSVWLCHHPNLLHKHTWNQVSVCIPFNQSSSALGRGRSREWEHVYVGLIGTDEICCQSQPLVFKEFNDLKLFQAHTVVALILSINGSISPTVFTKTTVDNTDTKVSSGGTGSTKIPSHRFRGGGATRPSHLPSTHLWKCATPCEQTSQSLSRAKPTAPLWAATETQAQKWWILH